MATDTKSSTDVEIVPEDFQRAVQELLSTCDSEACLDYLEDAINKKRGTYQEEEAEEKEEGLNTDGMPESAE